VLPRGAAAEEIDALIAEKWRWIATAATPDNARQRCRAIRVVNEALQGGVAPIRQRIERQQQELATRLHAQGVLGSREYSFCLHPQESLQKFILEFLANTSKLGSH
jgi:hypothetical protein